MKYAGQNVAVFGVGAGGVLVAAAVADALGADLDVLAVRQLTLPGQPDQAWGAVAVLGDCVQIVAEHDTTRQRPLPAELTDTVRQRDVNQLRQLENTYRAGRSAEQVTGRLVIVVGDGLSSLAIMRAAVSAVRRQHPAHLVLALPTGTPQVCRMLGQAADEVVCSLTPGPRHAESVYCENATISVGDVRRLLSAQVARATTA